MTVARTTGKTTAGKPSEGTFCLVLHSHLPWLAHHGTWPVGEEWLYQAWAHSYLPVVDMLRRFADEGREDVLTLGITPVLAAQLDDPYCLRGAHDWLGNWHLRSHYAGARLRELSAYEHRASSWALDQFETHWRHGFSPVLKSLVDSSTIELLGGPATHPFQPLLDPRVRSFALRTGLDDTALRIGRAPEGIWAPECGYSPGMETGYAAAGVRRFMVDGPALHGDTSSAHPVGSSDVLAFGRDLEVSYRVWSPKVGYPGDAAYRDFHTFDHPTGLKPSRVTGKNVAPEDKRPYEPLLAREAISRHVDDFVETVVRRLRAIDGGLVVAAYDTELYGHWWHEGPLWLEAVLRALPEAGVHVTTLRGAVEAGHVGAPVELPASSWGSGKDWRVWDGAQVSDIVSLNESVQKELLELDFSSDVRDPVLDQAVREALLALSSDWAFMVTKDSAADYARYRAKIHSDRFSELAALARGGRGHARAAELRAADGPFGHLDARGMR